MSPAPCHPVLSQTIMTSEWHLYPPVPPALTPASMLHLTHVLSPKVLSLTKLKGMNPKSLGYYITPAPSKCKSRQFNMHRVMKTKFPATVMVFGVVSSEDHIMPPHIFKVSLKVNTKVYLDVLKSVVIPWCNQVASGRLWVWQQDSAPAHKSKETQAWLQKECYDFVPFSHWPPSSPDLNPLYYFVRSYVKNITNITSHNTKTSLITAICWVFAELVEKTCSQFRIHIEAVIEAEGGYIE